MILRYFFYFDLKKIFGPPTVGVLAWAAGALSAYAGFRLLSENCRDLYVFLTTCRRLWDGLASMWVL